MTNIERELHSHRLGAVLLEVGSRLQASECPEPDDLEVMLELVTAEMERAWSLTRPRPTTRSQHRLHPDLPF